VAEVVKGNPLSVGVGIRDKRDRYGLFPPGNLGPTASFLLNVDEIVFVKGQVGFQSAVPTLRIKDVIAEKDALKRLAKCITIRFDASQFEETKLTQLKDIIKKHCGKCPLFFEISTPDQGITQIRTSSQYFVSVTEAFLSQLRELFGTESCKINQAELLAMV